MATKVDLSGRFSQLNWPTIRPWAIYALLVVVTVVEVVYAISTLPDRLDKITSLVATVATNQETVDKLSSALGVVSAMNWGMINQDLAKADAALPTEKKVSGLVSGLAVMASSSGALLTEVEFAPGKLSSQSGEPSRGKVQEVAETQLGAGVRGLPASLTLSTDLPTLVNLLKKMENTSQMLGVRHMQFGNFTGTGNSAQLLISVYYQPAQTSGLDWKAVAPLSAAEEKTLAGVSGQDVFILR